MPKRRKTRQEKIILQLKRQLARQQTSRTTKTQSRQEGVSKSPPAKTKKIKKRKKSDNSIFSYNPSLVKKDLLKTLGLTLATLGLEFMLYLRLR